MILDSSSSNHHSEMEVNMMVDSHTVKIHSHVKSNIFVIYEGTLGYSSELVTCLLEKHHINRGMAKTTQEVSYGEMFNGTKIDTCLKETDHSQHRVLN